MNRKKLTLFILLILLVLAVVWSFMSVPRQKRVTTLKYAPGQAKAPVQVAATPAPKRASSTAAAGDERVLRMDLLEREQTGFKGYRRNIFKPIFMDDIKLMKMKAVAIKPPPSLPPVVAPPPKIAPPVDPPDTLKSTLARFVFLGYLKKDNRKTIFLSRDKDIILVRKGDTFAGRYEAKSITDQALTIVATDSGEEIIIPLLENQPLVAAKK
ncbi:MAG: hypothetical protein IPQ16_11500 [Geobacteraceae bacterium]|nr:hypothetical protein [Geobacteraceae bacterium]